MPIEDNPPLGGVYIEHFGVKGMKWGIRKKEPRDASNLTLKAPGVTVRADGSIDIKPGASLQRLVRSNGKSAPMKNLTYASMLEYDNARYVKIIGGTKASMGRRDQILGLTATKKITAPSKDEATKMVSDMMLNDPEFRKRNTMLFGAPIGDKELGEIRKDPGGKTAQAWYEITNTKMTLDAKFDPDAPFVQTMLKDRLASAGHNALRDENDAGGRNPLAKAPIIIFSPETALKVTSVTSITKDLQAANKETLATYKDQGKEWLDKQLYGET